MIGTSTRRSRTSRPKEAARTRLKLPARPSTPAPRRDGGVGRSSKVSASAKSERSNWSNSRDLKDAINAHSTNTVEEMDHALGQKTDWLEGDIREEIDRPGRLEMRHDEGHESGDNLTLSEWLDRGKRSGRGLKLDIKDSDFTPRVLDEVSASGVPGDRLMFNLGYGESKKYGPEIRERFPDAIMAINPPSEELDSKSLEKMGKLADSLGGKSTFPIREDLLTDEAVDTLERHGSVSIWNNPGTALPGERSLDERREELVRRGVTGMIDLRGDDSLLEQGHDAVKKLLNGLGL